MAEDFREIGLTEVESKVYLKLIELKKATSGLIAKKSGIHRRTVLDALERLIGKGLVSYIKENNRRFFSPANPERILEIMEEEKEKLENKVKLIKPRYDISQDMEETVFFRGKQGLKTVFDDQIREGKEIFVIGGSKNAEDILDFYFCRYNKLRVNKKIKLSVIFACEKINKKYILSNFRYLPKKYDTYVSTNIYGDKVAIIHWDKLFVILIKSKEVAKAYKNYFDILWNRAKK
ncbi:MAG: helix-turn-helix domain-containing protein [Nanoarchaeota archaeon]|nr:helix-turn-helix domain-containing protein [Nanoarchaeota archaeon]